MMDLDVLIVGDEGHRMACALAEHDLRIAFIRGPQPCLSQADLHLLMNPALQAKQPAGGFDRRRFERLELQRLERLRAVQQQQRSQHRVVNLDGRVQLRRDARVIHRDGSSSQLLRPRRIVIATGASVDPYESTSSRPAQESQHSNRLGTSLSPLRPAHWSIAAGPERRSIIIGWNPWTLVTAVRLAVSGGHVTLVDLPSAEHRIPGDLVRLKQRLQGYGISVVEAGAIRSCETIGLGVQVQTDRVQLLADFLIDGSALRGNTRGLELPLAGVHVEDSGHINCGTEAETANRQLYGFGQVVVPGDGEGCDQDELLGILVSDLEFEHIDDEFASYLLPFPAR